MRQRKAAEAARGGTIGLDLSLRCAAAVFIPDDGLLAREADCKAFESQIFGYALKGATPEQEVGRLAQIAEGIAQFVSGRSVEWTDNVHVFAEDYAYGLAGRGGIRLGELGGAVKVVLWERHGLVVQPINMMTARKLLLGKLPRKDSQVAVHTMLRAMGLVFETSDVGDAFLVANAGRHVRGLTAFAG